MFSNVFFCTSAVTIGFTATSYTSFEDEAQVCVNLMNGILASGTTVNYRIKTTNTGEFSKVDIVSNKNQEVPLVKRGSVTTCSIYWIRLILLVLNFS